MKNKKSCSRRKFVETLGVSAAALPLLGVKGLVHDLESPLPPFAKGGRKEEDTKEGKEYSEAEFIQGAKTPNVIFILSDDHRYDFMGFMGKPEFLKTPGMDKMAGEGAHIQNAFVTTALCSPSRASVLTGMFSHRHGVVDNDSPIPPHNVFFPEYLQQRGYETGFIGKWHMGAESDEPRKGFDKWISFRGQGVYNDPLLNIDGRQVQHKGYITDILTGYAVDFIKQKRDKPFFLYLSHKAVHAEFIPAPRHKGKFEKEKIDYPLTMENTKENFADKPDWVKEQRYGTHGVDFMYEGNLKETFDGFYKRYCETLLALDEGIEKVIDTLEKSDLIKSTVVFYMGDNGFSLGEHGLIDKRHMYEESMRVPLLVYSPGLIKPGIKIPELIQNIDIAPTILELAGIKSPGNMDGRSFVPLLKEEKVSWRDEVFYEYFWERPFPHTPTVFGVRTKKYKYMTYHGIWDIDELYDIEKDPEERYNLIKDPSHQGLIKDLNKKVYDWLESTDGMQIPLRKDIGWRADKRRG